MHYSMPIEKYKLVFFFSKQRTRILKSISFLFFFFLLNHLLTGDNDRDFHKTFVPVLRNLECALEVQVQKARNVVVLDIRTWGKAHRKRSLRMPVNKLKIKFYAQLKQ